MTTIKSYTDLEQSKILSEFLPCESADMEFMFLKRDNSMVSRVPFVKDGTEEPECCYIFIPCWSLSSLLNVIPKHIDEFNVLRIDISTNDFAMWYDKIGFGVNNELPDMTRESAVDACFEMIIHLHEQKLL